MCWSASSSWRRGSQANRRLARSGVIVMSAFAGPPALRPDYATKLKPELLQMSGPGQVRPDRSTGRPQRADLPHLRLR